jgi:hypothetical protein
LDALHMRVQWKVVWWPVLMDSSCKMPACAEVGMKRAELGMAGRRSGHAVVSMHGRVWYGRVIDD